MLFNFFFSFYFFQDCVERLTLFGTGQATDLPVDHVTHIQETVQIFISLYKITKSYIILAFFFYFLMYIHIYVYILYIRKEMEENNTKPR